MGGWLAANADPVLMNARQLLPGTKWIRWSLSEARAETEHYGSNAFAQSQQLCRG